MNISLSDYLQFLDLWIKKRTEVHLGDLVIYPTMVRHCLCCQGSANYARETNGLCRKCNVEMPCTMCGEPFTPSLDTVGTYCAKCWGTLESTWVKTFQEEDPVRAEAAVKALVIKAHPSLDGCGHCG